MANALARRGPGSGPWSLRLFQSGPLPPFATGMLLAAALLGAYVGVELVSGRLGPALADAQSRRIFRGILIMLAMLAYVPTARFYLTRWTRRHIEQLQPLLRTPVGPEVAPEATRSSASGRAAGAGGMVAFLVLFLLVPSGRGEFVRPGYWTFEHAFPWVMVPVLGWMLARFAHDVVRDAHTISARAAELRRMDLIELVPPAPFVQQGLGGALLVIVLLAIGMGGIIDQQAVLPSALTTVVVMSAIGVTALLLPLLGVRRRIRLEKRAQLGALRAQIDADRAAALAEGPDLDRVAARLPGLLALEARLEGVREWPLDVSSLLRFALYVLLGLGSWLGAAFVERLLDLALG